MYLSRLTKEDYLTIFNLIIKTMCFLFRSACCNHIVQFNLLFNVAVKNIKFKKSVQSIKNNFKAVLAACPWLVCSKMAINVAGVVTAELC